MNHTTTHRAALGTRPSDHVAEELHRHDKHLRDVKGLTAGTRHDRVRVAGRLLREKFKGRAIDITKPKPFFREGKRPPSSS